jgi:hypothetical protein
MLILGRRINARSILQKSIWCAATAKLIEKEQPDAVIVATGVMPSIPQRDGRLWDR